MLKDMNYYHFLENTKKQLLDIGIDAKKSSP